MTRFRWLPSNLNNNGIIKQQQPGCREVLILFLGPNSQALTGHNPLFFSGVPEVPRLLRGPNPPPGVLILRPPLDESEQQTIEVWFLGSKAVREGGPFCHESWSCESMGKKPGRPIWSTSSSSIVYLLQEIKQLEVLF